MCQLARSLVPFVPLVMAGKTGPGSRVAAGPAARAIFAALLYCDGPRHVRRVEIALKVVHPGLAGRGPLERCGATCRDELLLRNCIIIRIEFVVLTGYPHVVDSGAVVSNAKGQLGAGVYRELGGFEEVVGHGDVEFDLPVTSISRGGCCRAVTVAVLVTATAGGDGDSRSSQGREEECQPEYFEHDLLELLSNLLRDISYRRQN